jgi:outer membrane protein assembly factor BamB
MAPLMCAAAGPAGTALWRRDYEEKILYVVNASRTAAIPAPALDEVVSAPVGLGFVRPKDLFEDFELGSVRSVQSAAGIALLVVDEGGDRDRFVAVESESGAVAWERRGLTLDTSSAFTALGSVVLARVAGIDSGTPTRGKGEIVALALHDGRVVWHSQELPDGRLGIIAVLSCRSLLIRTLEGGECSGRTLSSAVGVCLVATDLDTGLTRWRLESASRDTTYWLPSVEGAPAGVFRGFTEQQSSFYQTLENLHWYLDSCDDLLLGGFGVSNSTVAYALRSADLGTGRVRWE